MRKYNDAEPVNLFYAIHPLLVDFYSVRLRRTI